MSYMLHVSQATLPMMLLYNFVFYFGESGGRFSVFWEHVCLLFISSGFMFSWCFQIMFCIHFCWAWERIFLHKGINFCWLSKTYDIWVPFAAWPQPLRFQAAKLEGKGGELWSLYLVWICVILMFLYFVGLLFVGWRRTWERRFAQGLHFAFYRLTLVWCTSLQLKKY